MPATREPSLQDARQEFLGKTFRRWRDPTSFRQTGPGRRESAYCTVEVTAVESSPEGLLQYTLSWEGAEDSPTADSPVSHSVLLRLLTHSPASKRAAPGRAAPGSAPASKRARTSHASTARRAVDFDAAEAAPPRSTQPQPPRDAEPSREAAGRSRRARGLAPGDYRQAGLTGQIKSVTLTNFMCHANFKIEFGPHVTLVSGRNGSGKSAVLQGIQACLGVLASAAGRVKADAKYIREGCLWAKVAVTLWNRGEHAYRHELVGDTLTVERRIGVSPGFQMHDCNGRPFLVKKPRKSDVLGVLRAMNVDAANPVSVMTQEGMKTFLTGPANCKKKYELFMQATHLGSSEASLKAAAADIAVVESTLNRRAEEAEQARQEYVRARASLTAVARIADLMARNEDVMYAKQWATHRDTIAAHDEFAQKMPGLEALVQKSATGLADAKKELERVEALVAQEKREVDAFNEKNNALVQERGLCKEKVQAAKTAEAKQKQHHQALEGELRRLEAELEAHVQADEAGRHEAAHHPSQQADSELQSQSAAAVERFTAAAADVKAQTLNKQAADARYEAAKVAIAEADSARQAAAREVQDLTSALETAKLSQSHKEAAFGGRRMPELCAAVAQAAQAGRFSHAPVGPIGAYLAVADAKYAKAVEAAIGGLMRTFRVHDTRDRNTLMDLARQAGFGRQDLHVVQAPLTARPHRERPEFLPRPGFETIKTVLRCTEPQVEAVVMNYLMDRASVESAVVAESDRQGMQIMHEGTAGRHITVAWGLDGYGYTKKGGSVTSDPSKRNVRPSLGADAKTQAANLAAQLEVARGQLQAEIAAVAAAHQAERDAKEAAEAAQAATKDSYRARSQAHSQMTQLEMSQRSREVPLPEGAPEEVRILEKQIQNKRSGVSIALALLKGEQSKVSAARAAVSSSQERILELQATNADKVDQLERSDRELVQLKAIVEVEEKKQPRIAAALAEKKEDLEKLRSIMEKSRAEAERCCSEETAAASLLKAEEYHAAEQLEDLQKLENQRARAENRPPEQLTPADVPRPTTQELERLEDTFKKRIRSLEREGGGGADTLKANAVKTKRKADKLGRKERQIREVWETLEPTWVSMQANYKRIAALVEETVDSKFRKTLNAVGHSGRIVVTQGSEGGGGSLRLEMTAGGSHTETAQATSDMRGLSGGERSFTTVAFIMAIGIFNECPWRAMDEYDVYMDDRNRTVATRTLLEFAVDNPHLQIIMLSPLGLDAIKSGIQLVNRRLEKGSADPLPEAFVVSRELASAREQ